MARENDIGCTEQLLNAFSGGAFIGNVLGREILFCERAAWTPNQSLRRGVAKYNFACNAVTKYNFVTSPARQLPK